jgi:hypothetical protein
MSKKTIVFKMPATDAPRRDDAPSETSAPIGEASLAVSGGERQAGEISNVAEPDQWVRRRNVSVAPTASAPPSRAFAAKAGFAVDLAAERDFAEVVALSLIVPSMLGWFWFANAMDRYRRIFAA